jgi:hypothetical protein
MVSKTFLPKNNEKNLFPNTLIVVMKSLAFLLAGIAHLSGQSSLRIEVLEGAGAIHDVTCADPMRARVRITGLAGRPISFAAVTFEVPEQGPGGSFADGQRLSVASDEKGVASVRGLALRPEPGPWRLHVTASYRGRTGHAAIEQISAAPLEAYLRTAGATVARR